MASPLQFYLQNRNRIVIPSNFKGDIGYFSSPEYQAFQNSGMTEDGMPRMETADLAYSSPYFGAGLSTSRGQRQDKSYQDYLNRIQGTAPSATTGGTSGGAFADLSGTMTPEQVAEINRQAEINENYAGRSPGPGYIADVFPIYSNPITFLSSSPITPGEPDAKASQIDATIRPFLTEGLRQAQEIFLRQQPSMYPGQTFVSPSEQTLQALQAQENLARQSSPILGQAQGAFLRGLTAPSAATPLYENIYGAAGMQPGANVYGQAAAGQMPIAGQSQISNLFSQAGEIGIPSALQQVAAGQMPIAGQGQLQNLYGAAGTQPGQQVFGAAAGGQLQNLATGQLSNIAGGGFLTGSPYQQAMMQAATRPLQQQFSEQILPGISSLYSRSGRLGSGSMERALERATEAQTRAVGDITANIAGTQYQQERALQQQALGQLAGVSQQDIATRLAGAGALEQAQRAAVGQQAGIAGQLAGLSAQDISNRLAASQALQEGQRAGIAQQAGLAGQLAGLSAQDIQTRLLGAQGLQQAQQAALGTQLQAAGGVGTGQYQELSRQLAASQAAPQIYAQQFLPSQTLAQVGAQREAIAAQPLQERMARYAFEQQLPYQQLSGYLSSVYGSPLGSFGTPAAQPQFAGNRTVGALGGALAGGLGGYALGQAFPNLGFGGGFGLPALGAIGGGLLGGGFF